MEADGEFDLIERLRMVLGEPLASGVYRSIGDDTAILAPPTGKVLFCCDMLVEGVHFRTDFSTPFEIGWKALTVNVSDIAAMAGTPLYAVVSLGVGIRRATAFYEQLYQGLDEASKRYGVAVVGGDTVRTEGPLVVNVAIMGTAERPVTRSGARAGDLIAVTGSLGGPTAGLEWFLRHHSRRGPSCAQRAIRAHQMPEARVKEAQAAGATGAVTSMIDISDGLAGDLAHICEESGLGAVLDAGAIPVDAAAQDLAVELGKDSLEWALHGGEDYQILMTVDAEKAQEVKTAVESYISLSFIGRMTNDPEICLKHGDHSVILTKGGYTHF